MKDDTAFWFGKDYFIQCPPDKQGTVECYKPSIPEGSSLVQVLGGPGSGFLDPDNVDRYLEVTYLSQPGKNNFVLL